MTIKILKGDCRDVLRSLEAESVQTVITSPPYWGLRDYKIPATIWGGAEDCEHEWGATVVERATNHTDKRRWQHTRNGRDEEQPTHKRVGWLRSDIPQGQFCQRCGAWAGAHGLEPTYQLYVENAVEVFREVWRVLRPDGTLWLNLGDCYATGAGKVGDHPGGGEQGARWRGGPPSEKSTLRGNGHVGGGAKLKSLAPIAGFRGDRNGHEGKHGYSEDGRGIGPMGQPNRMPQPGLKPKDLVGIPWRVAFALQDDGWWLRQEIIWHKPNPMPESVTDRCTKSHESLFLFAKNGGSPLLYRARDTREWSHDPDLSELMPDGETPRWRGFDYYFDQDAILEPCSPATHARLSQDVQAQIGSERAHAGGKTNGNMKAVGRHLPGNKTHKGKTAYEAGAEEHRTKAGLVDYAECMRKLAAAGSGIKNNESMDAALTIMPDKRNRRSVWTVNTEGYSEAHFATFPPALIEPCIKAGCPEGGTVLDPFGGAGTTGMVADRLQRDAVLIELNPEYADMAERRIAGDAGMFANVVTLPVVRVERY